MKFHRVNNEIQQLNDDGSSSAVSKADTATAQVLLAVLNSNPPDSKDALKRALPFQPRSYRDFMLFEAHYYGVAMGITALYKPAAYYLGKAYSLLTLGGELPLLKPPAIWYRQPIFYQSNHLAFYADGAPVHCPKYAKYLDVELELGIILGKELFNATPEEAEEAIAGFCVFNDFSARNVQMEEMSRYVLVSNDHVLELLNVLTGLQRFRTTALQELRQHHFVWGRLSR